MLVMALRCDRLLESLFIVVHPQTPLTHGLFLADFGRGMIRLETLIELEFVNSSFVEFVLSSKLDRQFPVKRFEAAVS